jgi:hypothetical protein
MAPQDHSHVVPTELAQTTNDAKCAPGDDNNFWVSNPQSQLSKSAVRTSPFLSLAAELRNRIYALIFEHDDPLYVARRNGWPNKNDYALLYRRVDDRNDRLVKVSAGQ